VFGFEFLFGFTEVVFGMSMEYPHKKDDLGHPFYLYFSIFFEIMSCFKSYSGL